MKKELILDKSKLLGLKLTNKNWGNNLSPIGAKIGKVVNKFGEESALCKGKKN